MHGMNNFGVIAKTLTDWLYPMGGSLRRLETRWKSPVKPGDTIVPIATVQASQETKKSRWATLDIEVKNQRGEVIATGEAQVEIPEGALPA
jgi:acyl dehydratase